MHALPPFPRPVVTPLCSQSKAPPGAKARPLSAMKTGASASEAQHARADQESAGAGANRERNNGTTAAFYDHRIANSRAIEASEFSHTPPRRGLAPLFLAPRPRRRARTASPNAQCACEETRHKGKEKKRTTKTGLTHLLREERSELKWQQRRKKEKKLDADSTSPLSSSPALPFLPFNAHSLSPPRHGLAPRHFLYLSRDLWTLEKNGKRQLSSFELLDSCKSPSASFFFFFERKKIGALALLTFRVFFFYKADKRGLSRSLFLPSPSAPL